MSDVSTQHLPAGPIVKGKLSRDDIIMRGGLIVIALYLIVTLAFPLYAMMSKSLSTYTFDLSTFEFQVSDEDGTFSDEICHGGRIERSTGRVDTG